MCEGADKPVEVVAVVLQRVFLRVVVWGIAGGFERNDWPVLLEHVLFILVVFFTVPFSFLCACTLVYDNQFSFRPLFEVKS